MPASWAGFAREVQGRCPRSKVKLTLYAGGSAGASFTLGRGFNLRMAEFEKPVLGLFSAIFFFLFSLGFGIGKKKKKNFHFSEP